MKVDGVYLTEDERMKLHADMESEEACPWKRESEENRKKDAARWSLRACDKVLAEMELLGFHGFRVTRDKDGTLRFEGVGDVPAFLRQTLEG